MTAVDLAALDKLRGAATPGPWEVRPYWFERSHVAEVVDESGARVTTDLIDADNAALIAAATNALPDLIAEARKYRALREAVETAQLDSPGDLLPGDVVQAVEWDDATEYTVTVTRAVVAVVDGEQ